MTAEPGDGYAEMAEVCVAVRAFCDESYKALARKVVVRMQRVPASGIFGDAYRHKTLWDEYCHWVQEGPYDPIESAWEQTILVFVESVADELPRHEAVILSIGAIWELEEDEGHLGSVCKDFIAQHLRQVVDGLASSRDMARFDPTGSD